MQLLKKPIFCSYFVTNKCNSRCVFCDIWKKPKWQNVTESDTKTVRNHLTDIRELGVRFIDFTGGEPLLRKDIPELLAAARKTGLYTNITSNGILFRKRYRQIRGLVNMIHFSVDAHEPALYREIRGVDHFSTVIDAVALAAETGFSPCMVHTVTNQNAQYLEKMVRIAQDMKVPVFIQPVYTYFGNDALEEKWRSHAMTFAREPYVVVSTPILQLMAAGGNRIANPVCRPVQAVMAISADGCLYVPCQQKHAAKFPIGDSLKKLYDTGCIRLARRFGGRFPFCEKCDIWCYLEISALYRNLGTASGFIANKFRYLVEKNVRAALKL